MVGGTHPVPKMNYKIDFTEYVGFFFPVKNNNIFMTSTLLYRGPDVNTTEKGKHIYYNIAEIYTQWEVTKKG